MRFLKCARKALSPDTIDDIHVGVTPHTYSKVLDKIPETAIQSKFSMGYILARAIIDGKVTLDTFTEEAIRDTFGYSVWPRRSTWKWTRN